jgi:hypothetical protein
MKRLYWMVVCVLILGLPGASLGQTQETLDLFEGTFKADMSEERARAEINRQIDDVVQDMSFIERPFARSRLRTATAPCQELEFAVNGNELTIRCDDRAPATAPATGEQAVHELDDGDRVVLIHQVGERQVLQVFADEDGMRKNLFTISPDGRSVQLDIEISSTRLPAPLEYRRTFTRES